MRLRELAAKAIKGRTFTGMVLDALAILVAPNRTGKTAALDAARLALLGYIPGGPKLPAEIHEGHASAPNMSVLATFDDGRQIERAWMKQGEKVTTEKRISQGLQEIPLVMLDSNDYMGKSPEKRLEMIFNLMTLEEGTIGTRIAETKTRLTAEGSAATLSAIKSMKSVPGENFQRWLERALEAVGEQRRTEVQDVQRYQKTGQGLGQLQLSDEAAAINPDELETALKAARAELESKRQLKAQHDAGETGRAEAAQRRLGLQQNIQKHRPAASKVGKLEKQLSEANAKVDTFADAAEHENQPLEALHAAQAQLSVTKAAIMASNAELVALDSEVAETMAHKNCPTCSANKPTWKTKASQVFEKRRVAINDKLVEQEESKGQHEQAVAEAQQALTVHRSRANEKAKAVAERHNLATELQTARVAFDSFSEYTAALSELEATHGTPEDEQQKQEAAYKAQCEFEDAQEAVTALEGKQQAIANAKASAKQLQDAKTKRDASAAAVVQLKAGEATLQDIRNQFMQAGFGPLLETANIFLNGILSAPLEYRDGQMGYMDGEKFVLARVFSGAESIATAAAINAALGSQAETKIILSDELGRMDSAMKRQFILNVDKAIRAKVIDQFIGADVTDGDYVALIADQKLKQQQFGLQLIRLQA